MSKNSNKKPGKPSKVSKKKKLVFKKLGIMDSLEQMQKVGHNMRNTIDEIVTSPPTIVCVKTMYANKLTLGAHTISVPNNCELVMPLGLFFQGRKDKKTNLEFLKPSTKSFSDRFRRYRGQDLTHKSLLVWRFGGIGDLIFAQPLIMYLKKKYPSCFIRFATAPDNMEVFNFWPRGLVNEVLPMPFEAKYLDASDYHLTFEGGIERCIEAHTVNSVDVFAKIANVQFDPMEYHPKVIPDLNLVLQMRQVIPDNTIVLQFRASSPVRTFNMAKAVELINLLTDMKFNVGIIDSSKKSKDIDELVNQKQLFKHPNQLINLAQYSLSLQHCIAILQRCVGSIATDSSITHLSSALMKPTVGVYGPFRGDIRMRYYKTGAWVDTPPEWNECGKCPCFFHEQELHQCPFLQDQKPAGCMAAIDIDEVVQKFIGLYEQHVEVHNGSQSGIEGLLQYPGNMQKILKRD